MPTITPRGEGTPQTAVQGLPSQQAAQPTQPVRQPDTPVEPGKAQDPALSPKFAALARRERQLLDLDRKIKEREKAIEERETKFKSQESDYIPRSALREKNINLLLEAGYSRDDIANMLLSGPIGNPQSQNPSFVEQELKKVREELKSVMEQTESKLNERDKASRQQAVKQVTSQAAALIASAPDDYELVSKNGGAEVIARYIEKTFDEEGVLMTVEEAAKFIETELLQESLELLKLKKIQEKAKSELFPQPAAPTEREVRQAISVTPKQQSPIKTLNNQLSPQVTVGSRSDAERKRRAILRAQGIDPDQAG